MIFNFSDKDANGNTSPTQIAIYATPTMVYFQVKGAGTLRLAKTQAELINPAPNSGQPLNGLEINGPMGLVAMRCKGALYGIGSAPMTVDIFEMDPE